MEADWNTVKKMTLWSYEELIERIIRVFSYKFVQEHYNHDMKEAQEYLRRLLGNDPRKRYSESVIKMTVALQKLDSLNVRDYIDLIRQVGNREKCEGFLKKTTIPFKDLISLLNYIFRWVLPHSFYLRELIDVEDPALREYIAKLAKLEVRFNLDLLENGRTRDGRERISEETEVPETFIIDLVHRADLSRLPYSNRKTVKHLCGGGYDTLDKIASADPERMKASMRAHFSKAGMKLSGFIDLDGIAQWAKTIPKIVET